MEFLNFFLTPGMRIKQAGAWGRGRARTYSPGGSGTDPDAVKRDDNHEPTSR